MNATSRLQSGQGMPVSEARTECPPSEQRPSGPGGQSLTGSNLAADRNFRPLCACRWAGSRLEKQKWNDLCLALTMLPKGRKGFERKLNSLWLFFFSPSLPLLSALGVRSGPRVGLRREPLTPAETSFGTRNLLPSALKTREPAFTPLCEGPGENLQCASQELSVI